MASIFTKLMRGEIPMQKLGESETCVAFLDAFPLTRGHTLVVPKREVAYLRDLSAHEHAELLALGIRVREHICHKLGVADASFFIHDGPGAGQEVPHVHLHVVPQRPAGSPGLHTAFGGPMEDPGDLEALAATLRLPEQTA